MVWWSLRSLLAGARDQFGAVAGYIVQAILFVLWCGAIAVAFAALRQRGVCSSLWPPACSPLGYVLVAGCALPKVLAFSVALLLYHRSDRAKYSLSWRSLQVGATEQVSVVDQVKELWEYERLQFQRARTRATQHAGLLGSIISLAMSITLVVAADVWTHPAYGRTRLVAVAVGTAAGVSFVIALGRILVRAAGNDATGRMLAAASKRTTGVLVTTLILGGAAFGPGSSPDSPFTAVVLGAAVAILGDRAIALATDRAATLLGAPLASPRPGLDVRAIDGVSDEDCARLAEEGVDSVHALAFVPTPRIFFNTRYSMPCICDWQDQALLLTYFGVARAQLFRERLGIRGALDAQRLANRLAKISAAEGATQSASAGTADRTERDGAIPYQLLGFGNLNEAKVALETLIGDEVLDRLRFFYQATPTTEDVDTRLTPDP